MTQRPLPPTFVRDTVVWVPGGNVYHSPGEGLTEDSRATLCGSLGPHSQLRKTPLAAATVDRERTPCRSCYDVDGVDGRTRPGL